MSALIEGFFPFSYKIEGNNANRYLFLKKHEGEEENKPSDRTLFIINVPQFFNDRCLKHLFAKFGDIENIDIHVHSHMKPASGDKTSHNSESKFFGPQPKELGCKVAHIVFKDSSILEAVFKVNDVATIPRKLFMFRVGKNKFIRAYNNSFIDAQQLQDEISDFMKEYDTKQEEEKQKEKEKLEEPDEEGWVTVSKYSKKPKIPRIESVTNRILDKRKAAQSRLHLLAFYKNQLRDAKMEEIRELRKKFENDKAKIAVMRSSRKFKPF
ncbi:ribosomal RNA-processing protein 7 homolog A [Nephila pilipes]|uniref:Ribosomal RNA-processing protein 7 homolog A n=1 Tax=Nephila pilipes TaxID=299642 RepID=A0A8X6QA25_NEPPI|nr:ribosomal RNA-processing protein 7 homolog A [Nephila pilipes]